MNKKLARAAADAAGDAGAEVTLVDLADYSMPLYNRDLEVAEGLPENARRLKEIFLDHDGLLLACPEYNSSITPLLKNTLDWVSRSAAEGEPPLACYRGKVVALLSASPGSLGGLRGLAHVRSILGNMRCIVLPEQRAFSRAHQIFDDDGQLKKEDDRKAIDRVAGALVEALRRLKAR